MRRILHHIAIFAVSTIAACGLFPQDEPVTWVHDIAPIVHKSCSPCHRPGTPAPFDLLTYEDVAKRSKMLKFVTETRYMPPWPADHHYTNFLDEKILTEEEIALFARWHKQGAPLGPKEEMPPMPQFTEGSMLGEPDLVIPVPPFLVQGNNRDNFLMIKAPYAIDRDTFVRMAEFVPGRNQLVHHMNGHMIRYAPGAKSTVFGGDRIVDTEAFLDKEAFVKLDLLNDDGSYPTLVPLVANYLPGVIASAYPEGIGGFKISAEGAFLINDMHYAPSPLAKWDSSHINIFFMKEPPKRPTSEIQLGTLGISPIEPPLVIPPEKVMTFRTKTQVHADISVLTINPHMHLLGKSFWAYALTPEGDTIRLIRIPKWDFHWQYFYTFKHMVKIPKDSWIYVEAVFDNTSSNPDNPYSPPQLIAERNGSMRTTDEMLQFIITYMPYQEGDEGISLKSEFFPE